MNDPQRTWHAVTETVALRPLDVALAELAQHEQQFSYACEVCAAEEEADRERRTFGELRGDAAEEDFLREVRAGVVLIDGGGLAAYGQIATPRRHRVGSSGGVDDLRLWLMWAQE